MTIRVTCPECHRTLNSPDVAPGKMLQCPACGARFIGRTESNPPLAVSPAETARLEEGQKKQPKKNKRGLLCGCLAGVALVVLLGCGGLGIIGYQVYTGSFNSISEEDWKQFDPPDGGCSVLLPGEPVASAETPQPGMHKYSVVKPWARSEFVLLFYDGPPPGLPQGNCLDAMIDAETRHLCSKLNATVARKRSVWLGQHEGREARLNMADGRTGIVRLYLTIQVVQARGILLGGLPEGVLLGEPRVYELIAVGPKMEADSGTGGKFFNSLVISDAPPRGARPGGDRDHPVFVARLVGLGASPRGTSAFAILTALATRSIGHPPGQARVFYYLLPFVEGAEPGGNPPRRSRSGVDPPKR